jgi:hypothetical protein
MICAIYAKSKNIPYNVWTKIKEYDKGTCDCQSYNLEKLMLDTESLPSEKDNLIKAGFGVFLKIHKKIYIITCYHIIGRLNIYSHAYATNLDGILEKIELEIIGSLPELDISVLGFVDQSQEKRFGYSLKSNMNQKISYVCENFERLNVFACAITGTSESKIIDIKAPACEACVVHDYIKSIMVPKFPMIRYKCNLSDFPEKIKYEGLSGSLLMIDDNIVGINISINDGKIDALPMVLVIKLVKMLVYDSKKTLLGYHFSTRIVNNVDNPKLTYHYLNKTCNLSYPTLSKKNFKFKTGDIITKINNLEFNSEGEIYDSEMGYYFQFKTYLTINQYCEDTIKFNIMRMTPETQREISHLICGLQFDLHHCVNVFNNHNYIYWKGLTFVELSEELIIDMMRAGFKLDEPLYKNCTVVQNNNNKIIVLIDVDFEKFTKEHVLQLQNSGFIHIKASKGYPFLPIRKIDQKQICNIHDLETILRSSVKKKAMYYDKDIVFPFE